uniref:Uncharacterized protein n=1 Tax=uncultured marine virus TaxID=186617 RepID=A0A0F7L301_9VIRU|nr:hypothetical protein [uncultured marine virus]
MLTMTVLAVAGHGSTVPQTFKRVGRSSLESLSGLTLTLIGRTTGLFTLAR